MALITLEIPTLVRHLRVDGASHYLLRPLFVAYPVVVFRRYEEAVAQYQKDVKNAFKGFTLTPGTAQQLLWYQFHPELKYHHHQFDLNLGGYFVKGLFGAADFKIQGHTFIVLPFVENFMFMAKPDEHGKVAVETQTKAALREMLRGIRDRDDKEFDPEQYFSTKKEFITDIRVDVHIKPGPFQTEQTGNFQFFHRINSTVDFEGDVEIEKIGADLNNRYPGTLDRAFYQDDLVENLRKIIFSGDQSPLAIIGPEGVGKHAVVQETVWRYMAGRRTENDHQNDNNQRTERIWHLDPLRVISGMSIVGMWEKRFEAILKFVRRPEEHAQRPDKIMFDNVIALLHIGKSASGSLTLSDVLRTYMEKRQLQVIVLATPGEWQIVQEKDRRFSDLFQVIRMTEPSVDLAAKIILQQRKKLEQDNGTVISIQAIDQLLTLHRNYLKNKPLPGSVVNLMRQLAVKYRNRRIDATQVREEFRIFSGMEEHIFDAAQTIEPEAVENDLARALVGQPQAVGVLMDVIQLIKSRLADRKKPIVSFLFTGPTGVGKTQAAKVLCQYLSGSENRLMRLDMNEYIDGGAVGRLIGNYYQPEGHLTGKVRFQPFGVLLLDEIEKAHPSVFDLLLQVLDDGRLTDSLGRTVDFSNTVIIMTSNLGASEVSAQPGFFGSKRDNRAIFNKAVENFFRPEFVNRLDQVVIFNPLELDHILDIARLQIKELLQRDGFVRRTTMLSVSKEALAWVAQRGYDASMGGRALKRQIERDLTTLSAEQLVSTYSDQPIILNISLEDGQLKPEITPLDYAEPIEGEWLPKLPDQKQSRRFYQLLIQELDRLKMRADAKNDNKNTLIDREEGKRQWRYFDLVSNIQECKETLQHAILRTGQAASAHLPVIPLRLKHGYPVLKKDWSRAAKESLRDRLFQEEALAEINQAYLYGVPEFDSEQSELLNHCIDVMLLKLAVTGFQEDRLDQGYLNIESCLDGQGISEVHYLLDCYESLFSLLNVSYQADRESKRVWVEGYALNWLLAGEQGIHLFYLSHQNPLPVKVWFEHDQAGSASASPTFSRIIRIYNGSSTLTDLRTNFSNAINISAPELKLLLYAGLNEKIKQRIAVT